MFTKLLLTVLAVEQQNDKKREIRLKNRISFFYAFCHLLYKNRNAVLLVGNLVQYLLVIAVSASVIV